MDIKTFIVVTAMIIAAVMIFARFFSTKIVNFQIYTYSDLVLGWISGIAAALVTVLFIATCGEWAVASLLEYNKDSDPVYAVIVAGILTAVIGTVFGYVLFLFAAGQRDTLEERLRENLPFDIRKASDLRKIAELKKLKPTSEKYAPDQIQPETVKFLAENHLGRYYDK